MTSKNTICLWYDGTALDAADLLCRNLSRQRGRRRPSCAGDYPGQAERRAHGRVHRGRIPCLGSTAARRSSTTRRSHSRSRPTTRLKPTACGTRSSTTAARKALAAGARTRWGPVVADHPARPHGGGDRPRSQGGPARVRGDDDDGKDRHRGEKSRRRGGAEIEQLGRAFRDGRTPAPRPAAAPPAGGPVATRPPSRWLSSLTSPPCSRRMPRAMPSPSPLPSRCVSRPWARRT